MLDLIRIKVLADAGVPLARIGELLESTPKQLSRAVAEIDAALREQIDELERRRQRIAGLAAGERMFLPPELADYLDELGSVGLGERSLRQERDGWLLLIARYPERGREWLENKREQLADPEFRRLYRDFDQADGWDPDDPRVESLADALIAYNERRYGEQRPLGVEDLADASVAALLAAWTRDGFSPAHDRLEELVEERQARSADPPARSPGSS